MQVHLFYTREMGRIYAALPAGGGKPQGNNPILFTDEAIREHRKSERKFLMRLVDGDINEYHVLKKTSLVDFIAKFSNFTDIINANQKVAQEHKKRAKRGR